MRKRYLSLLLMLALGLLLLGYTPHAGSAKAAAAGSKGQGTEQRNWVTGPEKPPISMERYRVTVQENVTIPMRDGVHLKGRLYLPQKHGPFPTLVMLNGYGHDSRTGRQMDHLPFEMAQRGYAALHVTMRGTPPSEGEKNLYNKFGTDGYDVIEWAAEQTWSNGNVGTIGASLLGINQWLAAKELPPHLRAIAPEIACTDCYDTLWYPGGMLPGPGRAARGNPEYTSAVQHRNFDRWWRERTVLAEDLQAMADHGIAALISGGWNDYITPGNVKAFAEYSTMNGSSKLIIGPEAHTSIKSLLPYSYRNYQQLWFDHYLLGLDNGIDLEDPVLIYVQGPNQWRFEKAWPIPDANLETLYLSQKRSGTAKSLNDGSLAVNQPTEKKSVARYSYSPVSGPLLPAMRSNDNGITRADQRPYEAKTLTWTTDALSVPTEVTGTLKFTFWAAANAKDTDFVIQITDVAPGGESKQVTTGYLNAPRAKSRSHPVPLTPGKIEQYQIETLPTSYVFAAGHRIRLSIAGGSKALPHQIAPQGPGLNPTPATVTIYQDAYHPSNLEIPVIGTHLKSQFQNPTAQKWTSFFEHLKALMQRNDNKPVVRQ
ncbi:CocE/NonD family hydrolase [Brevibacillus massiliensis]|uniref:CocE/NonD family hydrolase n=2 Tax=Brevibacillus massiliensis TaxID=1118054 RepID=UPI0002D88AC4|nr:CocE/NonD family hydrolase [Brevibacillus massiliensis]